jgi:hypothetical protein
MSVRSALGSAALALLAGVLVLIVTLITATASAASTRAGTLRARVAAVGAPAAARIDGAAPGDNAGRVAGGGDVNGDGRVDILVGAELADGNGREDSGSAYVVFGKRRRAGVDLARLGGQGSGLRIDGAAAGDHAGRSPEPAT